MTVKEFMARKNNEVLTEGEEYAYDFLTTLGKYMLLFLMGAKFAPPIFSFFYAMLFTPFYQNVIDAYQVIQ